MTKIEICANNPAKYHIDEKVYIFNVGMQHPLVSDFDISGVIKNEEGIFYSKDKSAWVKEEYIYKTRKDAYKHIIQQAQNEMNQPEGM